MQSDPRLEAIFSSFDGCREELILLLQRVQEEFGYLSDAGMEAVARFTGVPEGTVFGIATFYAQFRFTPVGRNHVAVCRGTACHVRGARCILEAFEQHLGIKQGQTTPDREYSLETVACIGACGLSPCVMTNKKVQAKMTPGKVAEVFGRNGSAAK